MPFYVYLCHGCHDEFTKLSKINDRKIPEETPCIKCGESKVLQKIQAPGFSDSFKLGLQHPPDGFREVLNKIHKTTAGSVLNNTCKYVK